MPVPSAKRAHRLYHRRKSGLLVGCDWTHECGNIHRRVGERGEHGAQGGRGNGREIALEIDDDLGSAAPGRWSRRPRAPGPTPKAAPDRSAPRAHRPRPQATAISASPQATSTGPMAASSARSSTCAIIGRPWISASGLPGSRLAAMRAGITTIVSNNGRSADGIMGHVTAGRDGCSASWVSLRCGHDR